MKFATKAIHAGQFPDSATGSIMTPVYQTSTYVQEKPGQHKGYNYSRMTNPTRKALEDCLAALENGAFGLAFSSGMQAIETTMKLLSPGDEVIAGKDIYGGSYLLFTQVYSRYGITFHFVDTQNPEEVRKAINQNTKMIWLETPTNPILQIIDIAAIAALTKETDILLAVDNTFASPFLQNPLDLGADIVMHSVTKYLSGHSDVIMGALVVNNEELYKRLHFYYKACGGTPGPQDAFLVLRGIKTLAVRMKAHCENARQVAAFLKEHPRVEKVYWPGFEEHPFHEVAKNQMRDFGGMVSFLLKDADIEETYKVASSFSLFSLAESLGGVESLVNHSVSMTHVNVPKEVREAVGVVDNLIRLSVGIEDIEDILADLKKTLG